MKATHDTENSLHDMHVLLVEDHPDNSHRYLAFLQAAGADVTLECSGQSAVDAVRRSSTPIDAVVFDLEMPELDGLDATLQLRGIGYHGAIIAVAGNSVELKRLWFHAGCDAYLDGPIYNDELICAVRRHTSLSLGSPQTAPSSPRIRFPIA